MNTTDREATGVVTVSDGTTVWAWTAVRVDAAADLTETQEYADLTEDDRRIKAVAAETAWLTGQWGTAHGERVELRYLSDPAERALTCALLGRVSAATPDRAEAAALALRARLAALPRHVHATPVEDPAEVARLLTPFTPDPEAGVAEIRKRYRTGLPNRPDAGVRYYLSPQPFTASAPPWDALWRALAENPYPVLLTIGLEPYVVPDDLGPLLHRVATQYGRLGTQGQLPDGLWSPGTQLAPDASRVYADAARRYTGRAFRMLIALASPAPLPESLAELAGATVSPQERAREEGVLTETFSGPAHSVAWPGPDELPAAWQGLTTLEHGRWGGDHCWRLPEPLSPQLRLVAELVDAREAGAAFRLPLAVNGHMTGFPVRRPGLAGETAYRARTGPRSPWAASSSTTARPAPWASAWATSPGTPCSSGPPVRARRTRRWRSASSCGATTGYRSWSSSRSTPSWTTTAGWPHGPGSRTSWCSPWATRQRLPCV